jgi:hypothetical protein
LGEVNYDHFLAECSQAATVDCGAAAHGFALLFEDAALRQQMGEAGRSRAVANFAWPRVIAAYEAMWREQDSQRRQIAAQAAVSPRSALALAAYPPPEQTFAGYPTHWLDGADRLQAALDAEPRLQTLLKMPLTCHESQRRCADAATLLQVLQAASQGRSIADLEGMLRAAGVDHLKSRATLAWMLKYDLLRRL